jgi:superfamily II DNA/RNA helicase
LWFVVSFGFLPKHRHSKPHDASLSHNGNRRSSILHCTSSSSLQYDATLSDQTFQELYQDHLPQWLLDKCAEYGYVYPTLIQQRTLDALYKDENVSPNSMVVQAQTGSGKSLAYLLPLLAKLKDRASVQAVIVVPTRELGLQVATVAKQLTGRKFMIMSLLQGSQLRRQRAWAWAETPQVVVGTPNELLDMVQYGGLPRISSINTVVVDEVDACLVHNSGAGSMVDATTSSSLQQLLSKHLSPTYAVERDEEDFDEDAIVLKDDKSGRQKRRIRHRQTLFCSATIPQHRYFLKQCMANKWTMEEPIFVCTSPGEALPPTLTHGYIICKSKQHKLSTLRRMLKQKLFASSNKVLIFFDAARPMEDYGKILAEDLKGGVFYVDGKSRLEDLQHTPVVSVLRFEDSLSQRSGATSVFAGGEAFRVMMTTDLAARGLDLSGITHVIHFDLPPDADTYLHRSGRTGRLGKKGQVISVLTPDQEFVLNRLANVLDVDIKCVGRQKVQE